MHQKDQIQIFTSGNATFKNISQKNKKIIEESQEIKSTLQDNKWYIQNENYQKENWAQIFPNMSECSAQTILLGCNNRIQIISQLQYAQYVNLKSLFLRNNKINNIQALTFIHFWCLQCLGLNFNQISQITCLTRLSAPFLKNLYLNQNPLTEINALTKSKINLKQLKWLNLQYLERSDPIHHDLSVIAKLSCQSAQLIKLRQNKRINQVKVQSMLKLRFPSIKIIK